MDPCTRLILGRATGPAAISSGRALGGAPDDIGRGPGHTAADGGIRDSLMAPAAHPGGRFYLLTNFRWAGEERPYHCSIKAYMLQTDFGERFAALADCRSDTITSSPAICIGSRGASDTPAAP